MPEVKMEGLSLSFCISDIVSGRVPLESMSIIVSGTAAISDDAFRKLLVQYSKTYWRGFTTEASSLAWSLWKEGRIIQPRLNGERPLNIADGHWRYNDPKNV